MLVHVNGGLFKPGMIRFIHQLFRFAVGLVHIRRDAFQFLGISFNCTSLLGSCSKEAAWCAAFSARPAMSLIAHSTAPLRSTRWECASSRWRLSIALGRSLIERGDQDQVRTERALGLPRRIDHHSASPGLSRGVMIIRFFTTASARASRWPIESSTVNSSAGGRSPGIGIRATNRVGGERVHDIQDLRPVQPHRKCRARACACPEHHHFPARHALPARGATFGAHGQRGHRLHGLRYSLESRLHHRPKTPLDKTFPLFGNLWKLGNFRRIERRLDSPFRRMEISAAAPVKTR